MIRFAEKKDMKAVLVLIRELAAYEKALDEVAMTVAQLEEDGFGEKPLFRILLAEENDMIVGMSFYYARYSTWKGKTLYLEDLIVAKEHRGKGYGKALFEATAREALKEGAQRMEWQVLDWNTPAIEFYQQQEADLDGEWINCRFTAEKLKEGFLQCKE